MLHGEAISAGGKTLHLFCFRGLCPLDLQWGAACTLLGALVAPRPPTWHWGPSAPSATYFLSFSYFKSFWQPCKYLSTRYPGAFLFPIYKELRITVVLWYSQRTRNHHGPSLASYTEFCLYYNMFLTTEISCKR